MRVLLAALLLAGLGCSTTRVVDCGVCRKAGTVACKTCNGSGRATCPVCFGSKQKCCDPCERRPQDTSLCEGCRDVAIKKDCSACAGTGQTICPPDKPCAACAKGAKHFCVRCYPARTKPCLCCCHGLLGGGKKVEHKGGPCGICQASGTVVCGACKGEKRRVCSACGGKGKVQRKGGGGLGWDFDD